MSVSSMSWAWKQDCSSTDKLVLLALADHADHEGLCWPGMNGIAEKTGLTKRTVVNSINRLCETGRLSKEERHKNGFCLTNIYRLEIESQRGESDDIQRGERDSPRGERDSLLGVKEIHPRGERDSPKPSINKNSSHKSSNDKEVDLPDWMPMDAWEGYVDMRVRKKDPLTPYAKKLAIRSLEKFKEEGFSPELVLNRSIIGGWKGLFRPDAKEKDDSVHRPPNAQVWY